VVCDAAQVEMLTSVLHCWCFNLPFDKQDE